MKKTLLSFFVLTLTQLVSSQITSSSWKFYRPGNTGIQGDMATALWLDSDGNPYIAANTGNWGEGGFAKFDQLQNKWVNYSNVDLPILGSFDNGDIQILDMASDSNGNLWMAKMTGAVKFKPSLGSPSIENYDSSNSILQGTTYDLDVAPDGTIWFANSQLIRYNPTTNNWTSFGSSNTRLSIQPKSDGSYWVWSADYYYGTVFKYDSATNLTTNNDPSNLGDIAGLPGKDCVDENGNFWALRMAQNGDFETLEYQKPNGEWVHPVHPYNNLTFYIDAFKAYGDKQALLVTVNGEVWRFDGTNWLNYGTWRQGSNNTSIDIDSNGNVWVCGIQGAAKRDAITGEWQRYRITNTSQIDYFVEDMATDKDGNVWMTGNAGTGVGGIQRFNGTTWTGFNPYTYGIGSEFPYDADNATAITCRRLSSNVIFSPTFHGIHEWNGSNFSTLESELYTSKGLVEDSTGRLWNLGEYYHYKLFDSATNQWITYPIVGWGSKILKDPTLPGMVWVTTDYEIVRTNGTNVLTINSDTFPDSEGGFSGFAVEPDGMIWTSTVIPSLSPTNALVRYEITTGEYQAWTHDTNWPFPGEYVRPFAVTPDGLVWMQYDSEFPSTQAGILAFDGTNVIDFPSAVGGYPDWNILPNSNIKDVEVKTLGDGYELWMSCLGRGIAVLKITTTNLAINNPIANEQPNISVYPNPASENVAISISNIDTENLNVSIFDIAGRLIKEFTNDNFSEENLSWDLKSNDGIRVASGVYLIKLNSGSAVLNTKIIVK